VAPALGPLWTSRRNVLRHCYRLRLTAQGGSEGSSMRADSPLKGEGRSFLVFAVAESNRIAGDGAVAVQ
jgi:hypothetical protein